MILLHNKESHWKTYIESGESMSRKIAIIVYVTEKQKKQLDNLKKKTLISTSERFRQVLDRFLKEI